MMSAYTRLLRLLWLLIICPAVVLPLMEDEGREGNHCLLHIPNTKLFINITRTHEFRINLNETTNEFIRLNLCTPLIFPCAYLRDFAVFYHNAYGEQFGIGTFPPRLTLNEDNVVFSYVGGRCNSTHKFNTRFELMCDFSDKHEFYIVADDYSLGGCQFYVFNEINLSISSGLANSRLLWSPRTGLYLNYTEGDRCTNNQRRYTVIELIRGKNNVVDAIGNHCSTTIIFETRSACPRVCSSHRHTVFDSLMDSTVGHTIKRENTEYSFNICVSIDQMEYFSCVHGGAGICKITHQDNESHREVSLGYPEPLPRVKDENITTLNFVNGSFCHEEHNKYISSKISLICDINVTKSYPDFHNYEKCTYHFVWPSRQSCGIVDCTINNHDCSIENELDHRWNVTSLRVRQKVPSKKWNSNYSISICVKSNVIDQSAVFTKEMSFGRLMKVSTDYTINITLNLYFGHGSACANGFSRARSVLYLIRDETRDSGQPVLLWEEECSVAFEWKTRSVCSPDRRSIESSTLSGLIVLIIIILLALLIVGIVIYIKRNPVYLDTLTNYLVTTWNRIVVYPRGAIRMF